MKIFAASFRCAYLRGDPEEEVLDVQGLVAARGHGVHEARGVLREDRVVVGLELRAREDLRRELPLRVPPSRGC